MDAVRKLIMAMGLLTLLWLGSCTLIGVGSVVAVGAIANSELADKAGRKISKWENQAHNEEINEDGPYHERSDYEADYYDNYE